MNEAADNKKAEFARKLYQSMQRPSDPYGSLDSFMKLPTGSNEKCKCVVCKRLVPASKIVMREDEMRSHAQYMGNKVSRTVTSYEKRVCQECDDMLSWNSVKVHTVSFAIVAALIGGGCLLFEFCWWLASPFMLIGIALFFSIITGSHSLYNSVGELFGWQWKVSLFDI